MTHLYCRWFTDQTRPFWHGNLEKNKTPENAAICFRVLRGKSDFYSLQIMLLGISNGSSTRFQYCARPQVWRPLLSSSQSSLSSVYEKSTDVSRFQQQTEPPGYKAAAKHGLEKTLIPSDSAGNHLRLKCCGKTPLPLYTPCHPQEQHEHWAQLSITWIYMILILDDQ